MYHDRNSRQNVGIGRYRSVLRPLPRSAFARSIRPFLILLPRSPGVASPAETSRLMLAGFTPMLRYLSASKSLFVQFQCPISFDGFLSGMGCLRVGTFRQARTAPLLLPVPNDPAEKSRPQASPRLTSRESGENCAIQAQPTNPDGAED
jgi:hypothetical protein